MPVADRREGPIQPAEAERLFQRLTAYPKLALAVSGGADSTAMMVLLARWRAAGGERPRLSVLTVDHGLRAESRREAARVGEWAGQIGLRHDTLEWRGDKPKSNIQAEARAARYRLLAEACHRNEIPALASAHHRDDQAETFLLRLARGSGVDGLAAMDAERRMMGVTLVRPLLEVPRARLVATLRALGHDWIEDPGNRDRRFARVRVRAMLESLTGEGVTAERLVATARHMRRAREALDAAADALAIAAARLEPAGYCAIERDALLAAPDELALRLLARALMAVGGNPYRPRLARLERLHGTLGDTEKGRWTLAGCRVSLAGGRILVWRETGRHGLPELSLRPGQSALWDGRYHVHVAREAPGPVVVRALGQGGWRELRSLVPEKPSGSANIAHAGVSFWRDGKLLAAPHIFTTPGAAAPFRATFLGTILVTRSTGS